MFCFVVHIFTVTRLQSVCDDECHYDMVVVYFEQLDGGLNDIHQEQKNHGVVHLMNK